MRSEWSVHSRFGDHMEALDRESFDLRADFFGRSIEQELIGSLDGPRSQEAHHRLREIAERRRVRIAELVRSVEAERWWSEGGTVNDSCGAPPTRVYTVDECPICNGTERHCVLACGHVVCEDCFAQLSRQRTCRCPQCRQVSERAWTFSQLSARPGTSWVS